MNFILPFRLQRGRVRIRDIFVNNAALKHIESLDWQSDFPTPEDCAVILVGHGSTLNAESGLPTFQHARTLRATGRFSQVVECFWKLEPMPTAALRGVFARHVFIVPFFISEGYFTDQVIPREMQLSDGVDIDFSRIQKRGNQCLYYCKPVGVHPSMTEALISRSTETLRQYPFPFQAKDSETTLFIAGHGTGNNTKSREAIERQVQMIRDRNIFADAHAIYMEEAPFIAECYEMAETKNIIVTPFFISDGLHSFEDIPVMLGEPEKRVQERLKSGSPTWRNPTEKKGKRVWYALSIGSEPYMSRVILEQIQDIWKSHIDDSSTKPTAHAEPATV